MARSILVLLLLAVVAVAESATLRRNVGASFVRSLQFSLKLRVCNAYPYGSSLDVYNGKEKLNQSPMPYKSCAEFQPQIKAGDKIDFKVGDASAGTFSISDLPNNDAVLLLAIYRHDTLSTAVSFESHVFSNLVNAQIAVVDLYKGAAKATARIQDLKNAKTARSEELRYDSVVAVNQGIYEVILQGADGETKTKKELVALNRESYVIMRCGVEAQQGPAYPQELIVFPMSDKSVLTGAARSQKVSLAAMLASALACMTFFIA